MYRLGIDIGGTFTDLVLLETEAGRRYAEKVLTTPGDPALGTIDGVKRILASAGISARALRHVIHGTTLVVNAIIERKGCRAGLLTTAGFRDLLEMRRGKRFDMDDLLIEVPQPLIPRRLIREAPERMSKDGVPLVPLDEGGTREAIQQLIDLEVESIAVSFLHSYRNPDHEQKAARLIHDLAPDIAVSLSSEVAPDIREYERTSTTAANAYTQPIVEGYLQRIAQNLSQLGYQHELYLMQSDAGLTTGETAARFPVRLMESGPAGGSVAARYFAEQLGRPDIVAFDMGGTTAKVSFIAGCEIMTTPELEIARHYRFKRGSGLPIRIPAVQMMEIGAGGGGIACIDDVGLLRVGPQSAGADPGPACYDRGGDLPTVTDANLVLGYLDPEYFLGGQMPLSVSAAKDTIKRLAQPLGIDIIRAAWGIHEIVTEDMAQAARLHLLERGADPRAFAMLAFGGAGPLHACRLARKLGMKTVIVPYGAGVASAFGFLVAPIAITLLQAYPTVLAKIDFSHLQDLFGRLEQQGRAFLERAAVNPGDMKLTRFASLRYSAQGSELTVSVPAGPLGPEQMLDLQKRFHEQFARVYGRSNQNISVEALNWEVVASGPRPKVEIPVPVRDATRKLLSHPPRPAYFPEENGFVSCPVYLREALEPGTRIEGPALLEERESTTVVMPGSDLEVDAGYNLCITI